ncbi:RHS domain-containing protein [uncultured Gemella sp.]|uniref:RHS domain-containing protein n=1 Tax=uncultured Gemella sp. TaxID=254352 RepID=UPI0037DC1EF8
MFRRPLPNRQQPYYFHCNQIGIPREMTDRDGNRLWYGNYTDWGHLKKDERVYKNVHQPFRL